MNADSGAGTLIILRAGASFTPCTWSQTRCLTVVRVSDDGVPLLFHPVSRMSADLRVLHVFMRAEAVIVFFHELRPRTMRANSMNLIRLVVTLQLE